MAALTPLSFRIERSDVDSVMNLIRNGYWRDQAMRERVVAACGQLYGARSLHQRVADDQSGEWICVWDERTAAGIVIHAVAGPRLLEVAMPAGEVPRPVSNPRPSGTLRALMALLCKAIAARLLSGVPGFRP
jgi:hypothetical protein